MAWRIFEVIRAYRQLGTAQAIALVRYMLIAALMHGNPEEMSQWIRALDTALCDAIADQLQILLPDELDVLIWNLTCDEQAFTSKYNDALAKLVSKPRRFRAQLEALSRVMDAEDSPALSNEQLEDLAGMDKPQVEAEVIKKVFHLDNTPLELPQFVRRLRTFKAERGL